MNIMTQRCLFFLVTVSVLMPCQERVSQVHVLNSAGLIDCSHDIIMCRLDYNRNHRAGLVLIVMIKTSHDIYY